MEPPTGPILLLLNRVLNGEYGRRAEGLDHTTKASLKLTHWVSSFELQRQRPGALLTFACKESSFASDLPEQLCQLKEDPWAPLLEGRESRRGLPLPAQAFRGK